MLKLNDCIRLARFFFHFKFHFTSGIEVISLKETYYCFPINNGCGTFNLRSIYRKSARLQALHQQNKTKKLGKKNHEKIHQLAISWYTFLIVIFSWSNCSQCVFAWMFAKNLKTFRSVHCTDWNKNRKIIFLIRSIDLRICVGIFFAKQMIKMNFNRLTRNYYVIVRELTFQ